MPPKQLFWAKDEKEGFILVEPNPREPGKFILRTKTTQKEVTGETWPANPSDQDGVPDNTQMMHLHEPSVLHNIRFRYMQDNIYTWTGYILIAVNPYKQLSLYSDDTIQKYRGKAIGALPPHVFAVADRAYRLMKSEGKSQSILISGESGAGKTETSKYVMKYLVKVGGRSDLGSEVEDRILESNPLMEAFGNAKTIRNNNSSRFGKYMELQFNKSLQVSGSRIVTYLLEQTRIVRQAKNERNYHIFYQLCTGATPKEKAELKLGPAESYSYLNQGNACTIPGVDDAREFEHVRVSMDCMKLSKETQYQVMKILSGILHLGNVVFVGDRSDEAMVQNMDCVDRAAEMLGFTSEKLAGVLLTRHMKTRNESFVIKFKTKEAYDQRDVFAKLIYTRLFDWLVEQINASLESDEEEESHIGILDIFGFESFEENSFEQLCINFTNETLQNYFNDCIFTQELDLYAREGIIAPKIEYQNNSETIELISKKKTGIFAILDEEAKLPRGKDSSFSEKVFSMNGKHSSLARPPIGLTPAEAFLVKHYAGNVVYRVANFLLKNNDIKHPDHLSLIKSSHLVLLTSIFHHDELEVHGGSSFNSVSLRFCRSLEDLMNNLRSTDSHFIRCIKPNTKQKPAIFEGDMVLQQLRCNGMMAALQLMHSGYATRCPYDDLHQRFKPMLPAVLANLSPQNFCEALLMALGVHPDEFALGFTRLFFKSGKLAFLEDLRGSGQTELPKDIVAKVRKWLARKRFKRAIISIKAFKKLEKRLRALRALAKFVRMAKFFVFGAIRFIRILKRYRRRRRGAVLMQSAFRGYRQWKKYKPVLDQRRKARLARSAEEKEKERARLEKLREEERQRKEEEERQRLEQERLERERIAQEKERERQRIADAVKTQLQAEYDKIVKDKEEQMQNSRRLAEEESNAVKTQLSQSQKAAEELRKDNEQLKQKVATLQKKNDELSGKLKTSEHESKHHVKQIEDELSQLKSLHAIELMKTKSAMEDEMNELRDQLSELEARCNSLQTKHSFAQRQLIEVEASKDRIIRTLSGEKEELELEIEQLRKTLSDSKSKSNISSEKALEYENQIRALSEEKRALARDMKDISESARDERIKLMNSIAASETKLQAAIAEQQSLRDSLSKKTAELQQFMKSVSNANEDKVSEYELKIIELERKIELQNEQIQELTESALSARRSNRTNTSTQQGSTSSVEVAQLRAKLKQVEDQSTKRIRELETSMSLLQMDNSSLNEEKMRIQRQMDDRDARIKELSKEKADLSHKIFTMEIMSSESEDKVMEENFSLNEKVQELQRQKAEVNRKLLDAEEKIKELEEAAASLRLAQNGFSSSEQAISELEKAIAKYQESLLEKEREIVRLRNTQKEFNDVVDQNIKLKVEMLSLQEQVEASAGQIALLSRNAKPGRRSTVTERASVNSPH